MSNTHKICSAYELGAIAGMHGSPHINDYVKAEESEAYDLGYKSGAHRKDNPIDNPYHMISYRVIQPSGGIRYHYKVTKAKPEHWLMAKLEESEYKAHYSIQNIMEVSESFYDTYRDTFKEES